MTDDEKEVRLRRVRLTLYVDVIADSVNAQELACEYVARGVMSEGDHPSECVHEFVEIYEVDI